MRIIFSILICLLLQTNAFSQAFYIITGTVLNGETGSTMQGASVVAENTTIGTVTDADGNFKMWLPNGGHNISVTYSGYSTSTQRVANVDAGKNLTLVLMPRTTDLTDVVVVASNEVKDGWEKYGSFFFDNFIGRSTIARTCVIRNPEVLKFYFSKRRNRLKVMADEPVIIHNPSLGYNIRYSLDSFTHEYTGGLSYYSGFMFFEEQYANMEIPETIDAARQQAFNGSVLHFMRSLFNKTLQKDGFEVQLLVKTNEKERAITVKDFYKALNYKKDEQANTIHITPNQPDVVVIYTKEKPEAGYLTNDSTDVDFQFSIVEVTKDGLTIEENGYYYDQSDLLFKEYWTWEKVGDMVPYDYGITIDYDEVLRRMAEGILNVPATTPAE